MGDKEAVITQKLIEEEKKILDVIPNLKTEFVPIETSFRTDEKIWTISLNTESPNTPLVMLHGFAASVGFWALNLEVLAKERPVYAIDFLGWGRSSRPEFSSDNFEAEKQTIEAVEAWRRQMKLEKIIILGHSMGAGFSILYAMTYPERIQHVILADEWGLSDKHERPPLCTKIYASLYAKFDPLGLIRGLGPYWGSLLMEKSRKDMFGEIGEKVKDTSAAPKYFYYCNARKPSGEKGWYTMITGVSWPKCPLIHRIDKLDKSISITFMYGSNTWMDSDMGPRVKKLRPQSYVDIQTIQNAGHHIHSENAPQFNEVVTNACRFADSKNATRL